MTRGKIAASVMTVAGMILLGTATPAHAGTASGKIMFMNQGFSLVLTEMQTPFTCNGSPTTQGTDGYVLTIPGAERLSVSTTWAGTDVDRSVVRVYYLDASCLLLGQSAGLNPQDDPVPAGTRYALVHLGMGFDVEFQATWS